MTTTFHRQITKLGKRSAGDVDIETLIQDLDLADQAWGKLIEHMKRFRDSWIDILVNQTVLADTFHEVFKTIPVPEDANVELLETPLPVLKRIAALHAGLNDLKGDMMEEVGRVDYLITAAGEAKAGFKPLKKAVEKREHKKLDWERFTKQVESNRAKKNKSDRDYANLSRAESELLRATDAYEDADRRLKRAVPPLLEKSTELFPYILDSLIYTQHTLLQHTYSTIYQFTEDYKLPDGPIENILSTWESSFFSVKQHTETSLMAIAKGKAVTVPMDHIKDSTIMGKIGGLTKRSKPPPPAPPSHPPRSRGRDEESEGSPPPDMLKKSRPSSIRSGISNPSTRSRDESPPPPLPGPRPSPQSMLRSVSANYESNATKPPPYTVSAKPKPGLKPPSPYQPPGARIRPAVGPAAQLAGIMEGRLEAINGGLTPKTLGNTSTRASSYSGPTTSQDSRPIQSLSNIAAGKKKPPPPPPKKKVFEGKEKEKWVRALYDFEGEKEGDLRFVEGERIKVLVMTASKDEWWVGEIGGRKGAFPANYCELEG
ncbi:hypothetical protein RUND412_000483 [Rhizina undulata]